MAELTKATQIETERIHTDEDEGVIAQLSSETQTSLGGLDASTQEPTQESSLVEELPKPAQSTAGIEGMQSAFQPEGQEPTTAGAIITQLSPYRARSTDELVKILKRAA